MNGIRTNGSRITPLAVASGAIASFDAQVAAPLKILKAAIDPAQEGSGIPSPSNIRPILVRDEINITNESGEIFEAANIVATESEIKAYYDTDLVLKAGTYVFSTDATDSVTLIGAQYYSGSWVNLFTQIGTSRKFTLSRSGKCHFRAELRGSGDLSSNTVSLKQLDEKTIELPDNVYGGILDATNGVLKITHGIYTFDGTEAWGIVHNTTPQTFDFFRWYGSSFSNKINNFSTLHQSTLLTSYPTTDNLFYWYSGGLNGDLNAWTVQNQYGLCIRNDSFDNASDFAASLAGQTFVYELATPIIIHLDPISMDAYAGSNKITTDSGNTTAVYLKGVTT